MNQERFKALFEQYLKDNLSPQEVLEFQEAIQDEHYSELLDELLKSAYTEPAYAEENHEAKQDVFNNLMYEIHREPGIRRISYWWRAGVAAMLLITLGAGLFFYLGDHSVQKNKMYVNDIKPGTNKATLTLANGSRIILSEALNGELANQAGVKISKTKNGEITYTVISKNIFSSKQSPFNILTTARHEQYQLILPDGSHVWLDAASSLKYPAAFTGHERVVELTGEAYFEVTHNPAMPFKVKTLTQQVEVLGTHFNIKSYADEPATKTTLLEGSVRVNALTGMAKVLKPGQQAINTSAGINIADVDTEEAVAWKNGYFMFNNEDLGSVMKKISRWYDVDIIYEDPAQAKQVFAGSISRFENVSKVLEMLEKAGNVHFEIEGRKITVLK